MKDSMANPHPREELMWLVALRYWAAAKTSGLGYSLNYSGSRLGGAVILHFQPFFLPTYSRRQLPTREEGSSVVDPVLNHDILEITVQTEATVRNKKEVNSSVPLGVEETAALIAADVQSDAERVRQAMLA